MLSLDSPLWHSLWTGYSSPEEFLDLLKRLENDPSSANEIADEFDRENHVCHQCDVYETTVAVFPHFIRAASRLEPSKRVRILYSACFDALRISDTKATSPERFEIKPLVWDGYIQSLPLAARVTAEALPFVRDIYDEHFLMVLIAGLTVFIGQGRVGNVIFHASERVHCKKCNHVIEPLDEWGTWYL